jgi:hypothetical protein
LLQGLRVTELHASHGVHFHAIINTRVPITEMNRLARRHGFGRMSVKEADRSSVTYLSKYLTKSFMADNPSFAGRRRWGPIGGFKGTKCKDLKYDTEFHRNKKKLFSGRQISFQQIKTLAWFSDSFGEFDNWPLVIKIRFTTAMQSYGYKGSFV